MIGLTLRLCGHEALLVMNTIHFTVITNNSGILTKTVMPDRNGGIKKKPSEHLKRGLAETVDMPFEDFGQFLRMLRRTQAICQGICEYERATIYTAADYNGQPGIITRTKEFFSYPDGSGLGMFDYDPKPGQAQLTPDEFLSIICKICPEFRTLPTWWTPSTSSCIYDMDGNELTGGGAGWHLYFPFEPANKLPDFALWLYKQLWIAGYGYIFVSKSGVLLERTIFDASVFSPERLDFVAGAHCVDCEPRLPDPAYRKKVEEEV